ncbi:MAG: hypothetical protein IPP25_13600 [Saprospiraceae bacterium]|nr:hypothetical protein [Candidatus Opimibacter skivensis]
MDTLDILSCTYCINPELYGLQDDVVTATVYSGLCIDDDMLNVRVDVDANIYIPNVFSPNDDGINDCVTVFTDHRVRKVVFRKSSTAGVTRSLSRKRT